jgi:hypothetical protein
METTRMDDDLEDLEELDLLDELDELDEFEAFEDLDELDELDDGADGEVAGLDDAVDLTGALRSALHVDYAGAPPEQLDDALDSMFESLSPAEAFNLGKALRQIERGASAVLSDPTVGQIARTALPLAGGAVGTLIGGPAGTAIGRSLGGAAAKALPTGRGGSGVPAPNPGATVARPAPTVGSPAATQGLILTQQPQVLQSLVAAALGERGRTEINGVPIGAVLNMLSSVFGQAAADADALLDAGAESSEAWAGSSRYPMRDRTDPDDRARSLYAFLLDDECDLLEEVDW